MSGVVREEVEAALQRHAHMVSPEAKAREDRVHREVGVACENADQQLVSHSQPPHTVII